MTITCTVTVANLYYAQPLLHAIGAALHVSQTAASLLVTSGQVGYAVGLLLVVPIGDITRRRRCWPPCSPWTRWPWPPARSRRISPYSLALPDRRLRYGSAPGAWSCW
jgi:MFS family permease